VREARERVLGRGRESAPLLSIAADVAHRVAWCCIPKVCGNSGGGYSSSTCACCCRTEPSVGSLLGCQADILQLDVTELVENGSQAPKG
jgi:hypothetical protein